MNEERHCFDMYQMSKDIQCLNDQMLAQSIINQDHNKVQKGNYLAFVLIGGCIGWIFGEIKTLKRRLKEQEEKNIDIHVKDENN